MKALSIVSPNGTRIAIGQKTLEIRRWAPDLSPQEKLLIVENDRFLHEEGDEDRNGRAVAVVRVARVRLFTRADMAAACASRFAEGWLAWELIDIRPVKTKGRVLAARGLYDVADDLFAPV